MATYFGTSLKFVQKVKQYDNNKNIEQIDYFVPSNHYLILSYLGAASHYYSVIQNYSVILYVDDVLAFKYYEPNTSYIEYVHHFSGGLYCPGPTTVTLRIFGSDYKYMSRTKYFVGALFTNG